MTDEFVQEEHARGVSQNQPLDPMNGVSIADLRKAIASNQVNFPTPVPIFPSQFRPDIQWRLVELYFVRGWSSRRLADRYGVTVRRIQQSLQRWADCAVARGYLQEIPPENALTQVPPWGLAVPSILIAAKDPDLRNLIRQSLLATGFFLAEATDEQVAMEMTRLRKFDLMMVNLSASDRVAADFCRRLRAQLPSLGIIVVRPGGPDAGTEEEDWRLIEAGADDCVVAPFRYREIVARIGAVLRRPLVSRNQSGGLLRAGDFELDLKRQVIVREGSQTHLSPREFDLLAVLMANPGAALTHTKLARTAWRGDAPHNREFLRTYIQSLRQKLENDPSNPQYIVTEPWVGYRFCDPFNAPQNYD